jgi:prolyl-tRNA editing enzyme YbaK/EbsC (Cys-tRNA(Pro) deacylase)
MRKMIGVLIVVAGVSTVSLSAAAVLWGLDKAELIDMDKLRAYPCYQLHGC